MRAPEEMAELYTRHPEAIEAAARIARQCRIDVSLGQTQLPSFPAPDGKSADDYLAEICHEGCDSVSALLMSALSAGLNMSWTSSGA